MGPKTKSKRGSETKALAKSPRPRESTLRVKRTWENFEESVGGREGLIETLQHSTDESGRRLVAHLEDPRAGGQSLRKICSDARASFPQLYQIYRDALRAKAHAETIMVQSNYLPEVMRDTCEDALSHTCPDCCGEGQRRKRGRWVNCLACRGTGRVGQRGSVENRKLVLESAGLVGKRAPLVAIQNNWEAMGLEPVEETLKRAQAILAGPHDAAVPPQRRDESCGDGAATDRSLEEREADYFGNAEASERELPKKE